MEGELGFRTTLFLKNVSWFFKPGRKAGRRGIAYTDLQVPVFVFKRICLSFECSFLSNKCDWFLAISRHYFWEEWFKKYFRAVHGFWIIRQKKIVIASCWFLFWISRRSFRVLWEEKGFRFVFSFLFFQGGKALVGFRCGAWGIGALQFVFSMFMVLLCFSLFASTCFVALSALMMQRWGSARRGAKHRKIDKFQTEKN